MVNGNGLKENFDNTLINGISIDSRTAKKGNLYIPIVRIKNGHHYVSDAINNGAVACIWEKGEPDPPNNIPVIFVEDTLIALQELAKNYRNQLSAKVVGVTGSNGKTTTKDMIYSILKTNFKVHKTSGNLNSEYGLPLTILGASESDEMIVLELGMSNRGEIETLSKIAQPDIAVITMIGTSHIANLGSREAIANVKLEIRTGMNENGLLVFDGDEPLLRDKINEDEAANKVLRYHSFGSSDKNDIFHINVEINTGKIMFSINGSSLKYSINIIGRHNVNNALAAISVAKEFGMRDEEIKRGLEDLELTGMRMELLKSKNEYLIINDAWNASPNSVQAAIESFEELSGYNKKILILGDMLELGDKEIEYHKQIGRFIVRYDIDFLFTLGELARHTLLEAQKGMKKGRVKSFEEKNSLIESVKTILSPNDIVLVKGSRGMALEEVVNGLL